MATKLQLKELKDRLKQALTNAQRAADEYESELDKKHPEDGYHGSEAASFQLGYLKSEIECEIQRIEVMIER